MKDQKQKQKQKQQMIRSLPEELIRKILSRLPVKSLLRFKCVSKSWNNLINNPYFIKLHINQTLEDNNLSLMLDLVNTHDYKYSIKPNPNSSNILLETLPELGDTEIKSLRGTLTISGSCNGLLLLSDKYGSRYVGLELWNPTTREAIDISCCDGPADDEKWECWGNIFGLGYDLNMDDYKVIRIHDFLTLVPKPHGAREVTVYSLKSKTWTRVQVEIPYKLYGTGKYVNGTIYWIGHRCPENVHPALRIVCFDFGSSKCKEIPMPDEFKNSVVSLGVWRGWLCLYYGLSETNADTYVMKKRSWFKLCRISSTGLGMDGVNLLKSRLVCLTKEGKVLLQNTEKRSSLVLYNPEKNRAEKLVIHGVPSKFKSEGYCVETYMKSLVEL